MKNPFTAPDVKDVMHEKLVSKWSAVTLILSGACVVAALFYGYTFAMQFGFFSKPPPQVEEVVVPTEVSTKQSSPALSLDERRAEIEAEGTTTPPSAEEMEIRSKEVMKAEQEERNQEGAQTSLSIEERLREINEDINQ